MGKIRLNNMLFYGYHGADESEQKRGGTFEVDLEIRTNLLEAASTDHLRDTIDYSDVYKAVHDCLTKKKYYLLEALANHIAKTILTQFNIDSVLVRVRKPHAPVKGVLGSVEIEIERDQGDF
ncbi:MAG: dihydroneopterin aldolase [Candidatus Marinimicrobia bacterium]|nr:dihydroneopterin aldolase [Candidatus Neomarinimicrobiota bacterium]